MVQNRHAFWISDWALLDVGKSLPATGLIAQSFDTDFGKNRVQYNDDFKVLLVAVWSDNFVVYWYGKGKKFARATIIRWQNWIMILSANR